MKRIIASLILLTLATPAWGASDDDAKITLADLHFLKGKVAYDRGD